MIIGPTYVFVSNPKTGTHTMYQHLTDHFDGKRYGSFHNTRVPEQHKNKCVFSTIRDPLERVASAWNSLLFQDKYRDVYLDKIGSDRFSDFVRWLTAHPPNHRFTGSGSPVLTSQSKTLENVDVDYLIRTEFLARDFSMLPFVDREVAIPRLLNRPHASFDALCDQYIVSVDLEYRLLWWLKDDMVLYYYHHIGRGSAR